MTSKAILGTKVGMTRVFDDDARVVPVTVLRAGPCPVVQVRSEGRDGYRAAQLGFGDPPRRVPAPLRGHFERAGVQPRRHLVEVRLDHAVELDAGDELDVSQFEPGDRVDVSARSKGKGFAGAMKRHGFAGQPASHGAHKIHRTPGAIGACATPSRVLPGKRMPGRMGARRVTVERLEVVRADAERGLLLLRGAVPGPRGGLIEVRDAAKVRRSERGEG